MGQKQKFTTKMAESLTANLKLELEKTNQAFNRWSEKQIDWLNSSNASFERQQEECEFTISALADNASQLENARGLHDSIKQQQRDEHAMVLADIERLKSQKNMLEQKYVTLTTEENAELEILQEAQREHDEKREKMEQALNDLTQGVQQYLSLGLEFQRTPGECMKFIFTNIDPRDHSRQSYFVIFVDDKDIYQMVETVPQIEAALSRSVIDRFNRDNDIARFVVSMRKIFRSPFVSSH